MSDRGIKKFLPFKSLLGQNEYIEEEKRKQSLNNKENTELSQEQKEKIYFNLEQIKKEEKYIRMLYSKCDEVIKYIGLAKIKNNKVLLGETEVEFNDVIDLEIINI